ncbi:hypothetical protein M422DRAFT_269224 [Sphaerobolus stellatus SS14]|uniref:Uncharacterized protein n=1 Tax=Sphaerobolus stellatus (strain SS14) TaxID=990650 RepID=A0A0C9UKL6_SPHS4|nr:hypothetical protein M422DRAFT_269224 [Sphaerobolus stellatus SS14]
MSGKPAPFRYSSTPPPKETTRDWQEHYEKSRDKIVEPLAKEPRKKWTPQQDSPTMFATISMAVIEEITTSDEERLQEENKELQTRSLTPVPGPSHDKGKQCAELARDLMRDPTIVTLVKKPKDSDSNDSGDDSDPSSSDDEERKKRCKKRKHRCCHLDTDDSDSDEDRIKKGSKLQDPDTFDGSNPEKLSSFLFQCNSLCHQPLSSLQYLLSTLLLICGQRRWKEDNYIPLITI